MRTTGYVSGVDSNGFYMQQSPTSAPWQGIWVYTQSSPGRTVGDYVEVLVGLHKGRRGVISYTRVDDEKSGGEDGSKYGQIRQSNLGISIKRCAFVL